MNSNKFWAAASKMLAVVTVTLIVALMLAPGAVATSKYKVLHKFTGGADGAYPFAGLILDTAGNLYGTTTGGSGNCPYDPPGCGTVFKLTPNADGSWTKSVLHNFTGYPDDGGYPVAKVAFDGDGNLYGTTAYEGAAECRCGTVFKLALNPDGSWTESVLYSFTGGREGELPDTSLIFDQAGALYGTTFVGGKNACQTDWGPGCGLVFKLAPNSDGTWTESVLRRFQGRPGGANPWHAGLIADSTGDLYGTTFNGGAYDAGMLYKLIQGADGNWSKKTIHNFRGGKHGANPRGSLTIDSIGNLYGTTSAGGSYGYGTVYKVIPGTNGKWVHRVIHQFRSGRDGASPYANAVTVDAAGSVYGLTYLGGSHGQGVAYKLVPNPDSSWKEILLHTFTGGNDGGYPQGSDLILDTNGNLYGTAYFGAHGQGVVFEITP